MSVRDWNRNYLQQKQVGENIESITSAYNFVPLSETIVFPNWANEVSHDRPFPDGVSGILELTIKNHSPLLVGTKDGRNVKPFLLPDGTAAIPGSSLRGMIRNVLEIAGYGKMRLVDDKRYGVRDLQANFYKKQLTQDSGQNRYIPQSRAGWLVFDNGRWTITPCDMARVERSLLQSYYGGEWINIAKRPDSKEKYLAWLRVNKPLAVSFDKEDMKFHPHRGGRIQLQYSKVRAIGSGKEQGSLVFTGQPGPQKHMEFIFFNEQTSQCFTVPENVMRDFLHIYQDSDHWGYLKKEAVKLFPQGRIPVFYLTEGGKISSLGLSQMYRLAYRQSVGELVDRVNGKHRQNNEPDLAELIFGSVDENDGTGSLKGRVSFSHAVCQTQPPYQQEKCEAILSSPKPTYYPNYIVQNEQEGRLTDKQHRTYMDPEARIRGWKRYPVKTAMTVPPLDADQRASGAWNTLYPIKDDLCFNAKLRFHNLRPVELGAVAWCLDWGNNPKLRHSIGMGKPFGFGQISISLDKEALIPCNKPGTNIALAACIDQFIAYMDSELGQNWLESEAIQHLLAMAMPDNPERQLNKLIPLDLGQVNQFVTAKKSSLVLKKYIPVKPPVLGTEVIWLEETLVELSKQTNTPAEKVLFTKGLALRWQALEDKEKKIKIRALIRLRWQDKWCEEHITGSMKIAKAIYLDEQ